MGKPRPKTVKTVIVLIVLLAIANVWLTIYSLDGRIEWIDKRVSSLEQDRDEQQPFMPPGPVEVVKPVDGYTPVKNVDYFDGKDGKDGKDSVSTHTIEREVIVKELPAPAAPVPELRCNVAKNRWEMRYTGDESWKVLNDEPVPCTINADILTQLYLNLRKE